jgi:hypothetical protein
LNTSTRALLAGIDDTSSLRPIGAQKNWDAREKENERRERARKSEKDKDMSI